ncbi:GvpL/GvpF family gas vesicle protein, partial [bacterium]|nr:GvpL/GvpF family gas vesicle protein [bacterium]
MAGLYVYGIIDGEFNVTEELRGMEDESVFSVGSSDIAAAVSVSEKRRFEVTEELLLTHERVVESLMSSHTILPMRYGTVVSNKSEILEIIEARRESIEALIEKVRGKVELGVKVLWNPKPIKQCVERDDSEVEQLRINIQQSQNKGRRYLMEKLYEELVQRKVKSYGEKFISHI